jgi:hypothetical protein
LFLKISHYYKDNLPLGHGKSFTDMAVFCPLSWLNTVHKVIKSGWRSVSKSHWRLISISTKQHFENWDWSGLSFMILGPVATQVSVWLAAQFLRFYVKSPKVCPAM